MGLRLITGASLEPLSLADARMQCNITAGDTTFDAELTAYIAAARAKAENYMGAVLMQRTVDQTLDRFPCADEADIVVEEPPAWNSRCKETLPLAISSLKYIDESGVEQTLASNLYTLEDSIWPFWVLPAVDTDWPATRSQANAVIIRMVKGYDAQSKIPGDVRAWLLLTVGFLFAQREAFDSTGKVAEIPSRFVDSLLDPYTVFTV
jgi:uncharacterized phiE125 gp8 family phage protein